MSVSSKSLDLSAALTAVCQTPPFSLLTENQSQFLKSRVGAVSCELGDRILRPDAIPSSVYVVISGKVRLLGEEKSGSATIKLRGRGSFFGWASLLCGDPFEWVIASEPTILLEIPSDCFVDLIFNNNDFADYFATLRNPHEIHRVATIANECTAYQRSDWKKSLGTKQDQSHVVSLSQGVPFIAPKQVSENVHWYLSTAGVAGFPVGYKMSDGEILPKTDAFSLPYRFIGLLHQDATETDSFIQPVDSSIKPFRERPSLSLSSLGIIEEDHLNLDQQFPFVHGKGELAEGLAVCEMVSLQLAVPFRKDNLKKVLEGQFKRDKGLSLPLIGNMLELLGLNCQIAAVKKEYIAGSEFPSVLFYQDRLAVLFSVVNDTVTLGLPNKGLERIRLVEFLSQLEDEVEFLQPKRVGSTPFSKFGWSWFIPLVKKYRSSLILVFAASLLAQLFGLAIPLLIQQIIDKVLSQGNTSTLNVLGGLMIVLALFRGILMSLRTYVFVDTTDRMDLTLGTAVIGRLLSLPLRFFDRRPVGELSQRIGELNTIRSFMTGTALVSVLNIIFALLYLVVMIVYSPFLTAIALSTLPLYFLLVFGIAPIYKTLIRRRAKAHAKTQSHLIEILTGINTVKAQHFELTARWKWQDRYRHMVDEGFKSTVLGATSGEIGGFLSQVSGLLVLWVGMGMVLKGELTLGMLIAFRIIAGNVTSPLLQLSKLYQGFQGVQLSMERLGDLLDQNPELSSEDDLYQIALPAIQGDIRFEDVKFRFSNKGPYQVSNVNLHIERGQFVGIVGQSGSGKSTLTKLIPRLYDVNEGRIFIDNYDISKVSLTTLRRQVGIVPQDSLLFEGTVAENIALNDPQASDEAIMNAASIACAHDFIMGLELGYATQIAERGGNLSGGQRQRIAIARTILSNPQLLIMDEATSALDYNTERQLCLNLQRWAAGRTVLFITHRLSTIKNSDQILLMSDGQLLESGTHDQLIELNQLYASLYMQQSSSS